jgi:hypothetical protein
MPRLRQAFPQCLALVRRRPPGDGDGDGDGGHDADEGLSGD